MKQIKKAKLKVKIENTLFYNLRSDKKNGFIKIVLALFIFGSMILGILFLLSKKSELTKPLVFRNKILKQDSLNQEISPQKEGDRKGHFRTSPQGKSFGYYVYRDSLKDGKVDYDNYVALEIIDVESKSIRTVYTGNYHTSDWEWLNENEVVVYLGCGTECMVGYLIDADNGERKAQIQLGVSYEWSPNKELVSANNYSGAYGITVGDKNGKEIFSIKRSPDSYRGLVMKTRSAWSPNSQKLALVIKKDGREETELLIFDAQNNFKQIFQRDIPYLEENSLSWDEDSEKIKWGNLEETISS